MRHWWKRLWTWGERVVGDHFCCTLTGQWGRLQISASGFFALQSPLSTSSSEARQPTLLLIAHCLARLSEGGNLKKWITAESPPANQSHRRCASPEHLTGMFFSISALVNHVLAPLLSDCRCVSDSCRCCVVRVSFPWYAVMWGQSASPNLILMRKQAPCLVGFENELVSAALDKCVLLWGILFCFSNFDWWQQATEHFTAPTGLFFLSTARTFQDTLVKGSLNFCHFQILTFQPLIALAKSCVSLCFVVSVCEAGRLAGTFD